MATPYYVTALLPGDPLRWNYGAPVGTPVSLSYGYLTQLPSYATDPLSPVFGSEAAPFEAFTDTQTDGVERALAQFSDVANVTLTFRADGDNAQIRYGNAFLPQGDLAHAYLPVTPAGVDAVLAQAGLASSWRDTALAFAGDVWMSIAVAERLDQRPGTTGFWMTLHETGHALGLDHPFFEDPGDQPLPFSEDNLRYTVMSYNSAPGLSVAPSTLMLYDIATLQYLYGANTSTRAGDSVYSWADGTSFLQTIWDGGGNDTIDASNWSSAVTIDLRGGFNFSSVGAAQNLTIAFGATVENAKGGSGNDMLRGNAAANRLEGGDGDDVFIATIGADFYVGGSGNDTVSFAEALANYVFPVVTIDLVNGVTASGLAGSRFTGIENITGSIRDEILIGDSGSNRLRGGGGNDIFEGGAGADVLQGDANSAPGRAVYSHSGSGIEVDLATGSGHGGDAEGDTLIDIACITGSSFADRLFGNAKQNSLIGGGGDDYLDGRGGGDLLEGGEGDDVYVIRGGDIVTEFGNAGNDDVRSLANEYALGHGHSNVERLTFIGTGNFVGSGDVDANTITGGIGDDTLIGGGGADTLIGGGGFDLASYKGSLAVSIDLSTNAFVGGDALGDVLIGIEGIVGSSWDDTLIGGTGNDYFQGAGGVDRIDGGDGTDVAIYSGSAEDYEITVANGAMTIRPLRTSVAEVDGIDTLAGIEEIRFLGQLPVNHAPVILATEIHQPANTPQSLFARILTQDADRDLVTRWQLRDATVGRGTLAFDGTAIPTGEILEVSNADLARTTVALSDITESIDVRGFDGLDWSEWATIAVKRTNWRPTGMRANPNVAEGGSVAATALASFTDRDGDPIVRYKVWDGSTDLDGGLLLINGSPQAQGATVEVTPEDLANVRFRVGANQAWDFLFISAFDGIDWGDWTQVVVNVAIDPSLRTISDDFSADVLYGTEAAERLVGGFGNNTLIGGGGNDVLVGGVSNDTLIGGTGDDVLIGGIGADTFIVSPGSGNDTIRDFEPGAGTTDILKIVDFGFADFTTVRAAMTQSGADTILALGGGETLRFNDMLVSNFSADDFLLDTRPPVTIHSGADIHSATDGVRLFTEVASDGALKEPMASAHAKWSFSADSASATGTSGRDLVYFTPDDRELLHAMGGDGDDIYVVQYVPGQLRDGDPRISETSWGGEDTVWVSENDYILPNYVENLVSMTERGVRMLANDFANKFIGGPGDDQLFSGTNDDIVYGREGNDFIVGGSGNDTLFGASGADTFAWELDHIGDNDRIMDWEAGQDRLDLRGILLPGGRMNYVDSTEGMQVWADRDGTGADSRIVVTLAGIHAAEAVRPYVLS